MEELQRKGCSQAWNSGNWSSEENLHLEGGDRSIRLFSQRNICHGRLMDFSNMPSFMKESRQHSKYVSDEGNNGITGCKTKKKRRFLPNSRPLIFSSKYSQHPPSASL